jgi:hypothetical protein
MIMTKNTQNSGAKKLSLSKETLRQLSEKDLGTVRGGSDRSPTADCVLNQL